VLQRQRDPADLAQEVCEMRERMRAELDASTAETFDLKQGWVVSPILNLWCNTKVLANANATRTW
jgi:glutamate-ammonia-ligase adenylyltransferase